MEFPTRRLRDAALGVADRAAARVSRAAEETQRASSGVDLVVAALLQERGAGDLQDPAGFVELLRSCFEPLTLSVTDTGGDQLVVDALVDHLRTGVAALPAAVALHAATAADGLLASREPYDRSALMTDVGTHARWSSSFGHSARFLTSVVRFARTRTVVEIGTAYGLGSLFLSDALARGSAPGRLVTVEAGEPQRSLSSALLAPLGNVTTVGGRTPDVLPEVFATTGPVDFLFHDGDHSKEAYVADFEASLPHLAPGAVVVFDDIRWEDPFGLRDARTAEGWETVARHPRVARVLEVAGRYGVLVLA